MSFQITLDVEDTIRKKTPDKKAGTITMYLPNGWKNRNVVMCLLPE